MGDAREREHVVVGERITRAYLPSCILQTLECASVLSPEPPRSETGRPDGAFMEPSGRNQSQPVANVTAAKTGSSPARLTRWSTSLVSPDAAGAATMTALVSTLPTR